MICESEPLRVTKFVPSPFAPVNCSVPAEADRFTVIDPDAVAAHGSLIESPLTVTTEPAAALRLAGATICGVSAVVVTGVTGAAESVTVRLFELLFPA